MGEILMEIRDKLIKDNKANEAAAQLDNTHTTHTAHTANLSIPTGSSNIALQTTSTASAETPTTDMEL